MSLSNDTLIEETINVEEEKKLKITEKVIEDSLQFWERFSFQDRISEWESICTQLKNTKASSIQARNKLKEMTKEFWSKEKEEQLEYIPEILRAYQDEINNLSIRSKNSETAFLNIYKNLYDAPDPYPIFQQILDNFDQFSGEKTSEAEVARLKKDLKEYEEEFLSLTNQSLKIRTLEESLAKEKEKNNERIEQIVSQKLDELKAFYEPKILDLTHQINVLQAENLKISANEKNLMKKFNENNLLKDNDYLELEKNYLLLKNSVQKNFEEMKNLEIKNNYQREEIEKLNSIIKSYKDNEKNYEQINKINNKEFDSTLESSLTQIQEELKRKEENFHNELQAKEKQIKDLQTLLLKEKENIQNLNEELNLRPHRNTFLELKKRLILVERIAFFRYEQIFSSSTPSSSTSDNQLEFTKALHDIINEILQENYGLNDKKFIESFDFLPLENMLTKKIQTLEEKLSDTNKQLKEKIKELDSVNSLNQSLKKKNDENNMLIKKLETEIETRNISLEKIFKEKTAKSSTPVSLSNQNMNEFASLLGMENKKDGTSENYSKINDNKNQSESSESSSQIISVLQSQRDRYKEKLHMIERNLIKLQEQIDNLTVQKQNLEADNINLYGKLKYLQNSISDDNKNLSRLEQGLSLSDLDGKYKKIYEEKINPFTEFSKLERQRKLKELSVADRLIYNTAMTVFSNKAGRNFFMVYLSAMHLLVFLSMYWVAHHSYQGCDPSLDNHSISQGMIQ